MTKFPRHILLIDDDPDTLMLLSACLKDARTKIYTAVNLHDAREQVSNILPEMIILDLVLPDVPDLVSALNHLKAQCPEAKFIAMSAYYTHGSLNQVIEAGFHGYLTKPFLDLNNLRSYLKRVMRNTQPFTHF